MDRDFPGNKDMVEESAVAQHSASIRPPMRDASSRRWRIAWLLGLGVLVNYFDRVNLSVSFDGLHADFGISDVTFGYLSGAYNWTYALCQLPIGVVLDRWGVKLVGRISILIWSAASFAGSIAPGIRSLFGARFLLGVGEAPTFPANAKATGAWFPQHERSFATSFFDAAAKFSSAIGVPLLGALFLHVGWRVSFATTVSISSSFTPSIASRRKTRSWRLKNSNTFAQRLNTTQALAPYSRLARSCESRR